MTPTEMALSPQEAVRVLGISLTDDEIRAALLRLRHGLRAPWTVLVPAYRCDIMHEYDLIEDVAVGHGYHRITPRLVPTMTVGQPLPLEELCETYRRALAGLGFLETMTLLLGRAVREASDTAMSDRMPLVANPASVEQAALRRDLIAGLLTTLSVNATGRMPQSIFEVGDCFRRDESAENGVEAIRRVGLAITGPKASFAELRTAVEALAGEVLSVHQLEFTPVDHPAFMPGRCAAVHFSGKQGRVYWGICGEIHPRLLEEYSLRHPAALAECRVWAGG